MSAFVIRSNLLKYMEGRGVFGFVAETPTYPGSQFSNSPSACGLRLTGLIAAGHVGSS